MKFRRRFGKLIIQMTWGVKGWQRWRRTQRKWHNISYFNNCEYPSWSGV